MRRQIEETAIIHDILPVLFILLALQKSRFWMKLCFQSVSPFHDLKLTLFCDFCCGCQRIGGIFRCIYSGFEQNRVKNIV